MSTEARDSQLPDPVYGSADANAVDPRRMRANASVTTNGTVLVHAHLGGVYIAMTEANWRHVYRELSQLEVVAPPVTTHRIRLNDANGTATIETVTP